MRFDSDQQFQTLTKINMIVTIRSLSLPEHYFAQEMLLNACQNKHRHTSPKNYKETLIVNIQIHK